MLKLIERLGPIDEGTASDTLTLPFELRIRGRLKAESDSGQPLGLFLDRGPVLRDGEGLKAENGEVVRLHRPCLHAKRATATVEEKERVASD